MNTLLNPSLFTISDRTQIIDCTDNNKNFFFLVVGNGHQMIGCPACDGIDMIAVVAVCMSCWFICIRRLCECSHCSKANNNSDKINEITINNTYSRDCIVNLLFTTTVQLLGYRKFLLVQQ